MTDLQPFNQFIILVAVAIVAAYAVTMLLLGARSTRVIRVSLSGVVATIFVHAYLILTGQGPDQFALISVVMMLIYGFLGSLLLDWLRSKFFTHAS